MSDLKSCPFCAAPAEVNVYGSYHLGEETREIICSNLQCKVRPSLHQSQDEYGEGDMAEVWNERASAQETG